MKAIDQEGEKELTRAGSLNGSPQFISPEAVGSPEDVGPRSDLYSLGATAYYLLTGEPVFDGNSAIEICMRHLQKSPSTPSEKRRSKIDGELEQLVMKCLEKNPDDRPGSARELLSQLSSCKLASSWSLDQAEAWWSER